MPRHKMVVLLIDQVLPLDFAIPMHVFAREAPEFYDVKTVSIDGKSVAVAGGLSLIPDGDLELMRSADTVVVPGYGGASNVRLDQMTLGMLRAAAKRGARMVSICSGAFALAQAGLLDGLTTTTHWSLASDLAAQFPAVTVDASVLFVDNGSVLTSGGVTAGVDLSLHILKKDLGDSVANHVARRLVTAPNRVGGQAQFIETPSIPPGDDILADTQQWMLSALHTPVTVADMAEHARLSPRHFHRRFLEQTSMTPLNWLLAQRIQRTKELLETTNLSIEEIAQKVGLGSATNLRVHFRRATSVSPRRHRYSFGATTGELDTDSD
jgi:transcriptional regulator GlxA family with amidase domain